MHNGTQEGPSINFPDAELAILKLLLYSQTYAQRPKMMTFVDRWLLFKGTFVLYTLKWDPKRVVVVGSWSLFGNGR
jgi:hypothetical protein